MKNVIPLLLLLFLAVPTQAEIISRNLVGTGASINIPEISQEEGKRGALEVKLCSSCSTYQLKVTPETKISRYGVSIKAEMLETYLDENPSAYMRLQFNNKTKHINYITLQRNNTESQQ
jgi:hypothetical protein